MELFEIKASVMLEQEDETTKTKTMTIIIEGDSFTYAEAVGIAYFQTLTDYKEQVKVKAIKTVSYSDIYFNEILTADDTVMGLHEYLPEDEKSELWDITIAFETETESKKGVTVKIEKESFIMPAKDSSDAILKINQAWKDSVQSFKIIGVKELAVYSVLVDEKTSINLQTAFEIRTGMESSYLGDVDLDEENINVLKQIINE